MPRKIGTENWRKKRRQEHLEMKEYRYYIFCEGEQTEPRYFSGFKKLIEDNPMGLVNKRVGLIRSASGLAASRPPRYASTCMYWYCISWKTDSWTAPGCF